MPRPDHTPVPLDESKPVFYRQAKETEPAWQAFSIYRDLGPGRTQADVVKKLDKTAQLISRWSCRWSWVLRVNAWDSHILEEVAKNQVFLVADMKRRHADIGKTLQDIGLGALKKKADLAKQGKPITLTAREATRLIEAGTKLEAISMDQPTEITHTTSVNLDQLTDDQLERIANGEDPADVMK